MIDFIRHKTLQDTNFQEVGHMKVYMGKFPEIAVLYCLVSCDCGSS